VIEKTMAEKPIIVGVISDTHALVRPEAIEALRESDRILHAGDVGAPEILRRLVQVAPVAAIRGNVDTQPWARALPATEVVEIAGISIYMLHNLAQLDLKPEAAGFRVVIYGHSHHPKMEEKNGVLYFNPGSAGPQRFRLPVSVGKLTIAAGKVQAELVELST
jgi:putative phosphoesterase